VTGEWKPLRPEEVHARLSDLHVAWWIAGGHALDLHLGQTTREHEDTDVGLLRADQQALFAALADLELFIAHEGELIPLAGGASLGPEQHGVWCRPGAALPWCLELMLNEQRDADTWVYRRDPRIERPLAECVLRDARGIPYLAPEIQLLFKSKGRRERDERDFEVSLPGLERERRDWLARALRLADPAHPWLAKL
jgi:hypothetical protein